MKRPIGSLTKPLITDLAAPTVKARLWLLSRSQSPCKLKLNSALMSSGVTDNTAFVVENELRIPGSEAKLKAASWPLAACTVSWFWSLNFQVAFRDTEVPSGLL